MIRRYSLALVVVLLVALPVGIAVARGPASVDCAANPKPACKGTLGPDSISGENVVDGDRGSRDEISGLAGPDSVYANGGKDVVHGDGGNDEVNGGEGDDEVYGDAGNDTGIEGAGGNDKVYGGPGDDGVVSDDEGELEGGFGDNLVSGGEGDDEIDANASEPGDVEKLFGGQGRDEIAADDGQRDIIDCGKGTDRVDFDPGVDTLKRGTCENRNPVLPGR
ncbi:hypothetical protein HJD18_11220 [Thermoleophilia bacterium SCSIO 60948]|nr:hypothetical protein HJD18_11220 [Thermoleophilia bacterium SCSIO 60948]